MGFFSIGNLLTLGIVVLVLVLNRQLDKRSRSLDKVRKYADKLKEDLSSYVAEREESVKDLGIELKVEQEAAKELMNRVRVSNEELAEKSSAADRIDERLNTYDASLEELIRMTGRVQENLNRIREESAFVDGANRRVTEAKAGLESLEHRLESLEMRFEQENTEALEKISRVIVDETKSTVEDFRAEAETMERRAEDKREELNKIEQERADAVKADLEIIDRTLRNAVEEAAARANRMEEAAFIKLKEQARERVEKYKTAEEEKLQSYQDSSHNRAAEIQNQIKNLKEEWRAERLDWETKEKTYKEEWKNDIQELKNLASETGKQVSADTLSLKNQVALETEAMARQFNEIKTKSDETVSALEIFLTKSAEEMKQKALEITGEKLEEYRAAQDGEFRRLETLTEDSRKLDAELRRFLQDTVDRVQNEFSLFVRKSAEERLAVAAEFKIIADTLKTEMEEVNAELSRLKTAAYDQVSSKLQGFEDEFFSDLSKRSGEMEKRIASWQGDLEDRLTNISGEETAQRRELEQGFNTELRKELSFRNERLMADLERLKTETNAFEEGIREQMNAGDISLVSYREELARNLEEAREAAEAAIKAEIGSYSLSTAELVKQNQRELESRFREIAEYAENRNDEIQDLMDSSRKSIVEQDSRIASVRSAMDDVHRDAQIQRDEFFSRIDVQAKTLDAGIQDAERHIRDFFEQAKLIDKTDELRLDLERRIEDLRADMDRLDQRRAEASLLESQFIKVKRLEDDVNAKMTRFISEQHRIEQMDKEFNRLLQTSKAVEDKLREVSASDDMLQQVQLRIRKIEEALSETDEKYQRIEKKNQVLENTNDSIDRNFRDLQDSEKSVKKINTDLERFAEDIKSLRNSIEDLAGKSEKAQITSDKVSLLDTALNSVEERLNIVQAAREGLGRTETRLEEINREILSNLKLLGTVQEKKGKKGPADEGAPPINVRESVIKLATKGWTVEEIAKSLKISRSEVELILEIASRE